MYSLGIQEEGKVRSILRAFLFNDPKIDKQKIGTLSGGEKSRLQFIQLIHSQPNFLLLDEPINHLDIPSMQVIEDLLAKYKGTLLVISHDRHFLDKIVNKIWIIHEHKIRKFPGNFTENKKIIEELV